MKSGQPKIYFIFNLFFRNIKTNSLHTYLYLASFINKQTNKNFYCATLI